MLVEGKEQHSSLVHIAWRPAFILWLEKKRIKSKPWVIPGDVYRNERATQMCTSTQPDRGVRAGLLVSEQHSWWTGGWGGSQRPTFMRRRRQREGLAPGRGPWCWREIEMMHQSASCLGSRTCPSPHPVDSCLGPGGRLGFWESQEDPFSTKHWAPKSSRLLWPYLQKEQVSSVTTHFAADPSPLAFWGSVQWEWVQAGLCTCVCSPLGIPPVLGVEALYQLFGLRGRWRTLEFNLL